jgi:iron complex outermembrane receptor protein
METIAVPPTATLRGVVLDASTDKPIPNAAVRIGQTGKYDVTDANGVFEFSDIEYGKVHLEVTHIGFKKTSIKIKVDREVIFGLLVHLFPMPIETSTIVITGDHYHSRFESIHELTNVLKGKELEKDLGLTLASTLRNETGLAIRSMGPAPARPVIRGLGGDRIFIGEDGFKTGDLSSTSPDHAVAVEPFTVERIEVIRGPKVLTQNSTTLGGIVNIVRNEIPENLPEKLKITAGMYGETVNKGLLGSFVTHVPYKDIVFRGEISHRKTSNLNTPAGELKNSSISTLNLSTGFSYIKEWGSVGASFREYDSEYGIPGGFKGGHLNGVNISMFKRTFNTRLSLLTNSKLVEKINIQFNRNYYRHIEFESFDIVGAEFTILKYEGRLTASTKNIGFFERGLVGVESEYRDFNIGGFVFTAPTRSYRFSSFLFQSFSFDNFNFEFAARYSFDKYKPRRATKSTREEFLVEKEFHTFAVSLSMLIELNSKMYVGGTVSRSSRVPSVEELYSEGPHLAAYSYEIGNPNIPFEKGYGIELFAYRKTESYFWHLTLFRNDFSTYIIHRNSGRINYATLLPIYQAEGVGAYFYGFESQFNYRLNTLIQLSTSVSYTDGNLSSTKSPLPSIPPMKSISEIKFNLDKISFGASFEAVTKQDKVDLFEEPTPGYGITNLFMQYSFYSNKVVHNLSLNIDNVFNKEFRNHLSRVKSIMPEAGRNFRFTFRVYY